MLARINTIAFNGLKTFDVDLQLQIASGMPMFNIVGLPDKTIAESKERVRAALNSLGVELPAKRILINLAPADLLKEGSHFDLPIAMALLAGLGIDGKTRVYEPYLSRNHSEIMLEYLGANIKTGRDNKGFYAEIDNSNLKAKDIEVTGDISSAAFFMVAAAIVKDSNLLIKNVGINPTRSGILDVFNQAQINYTLKNERYYCRSETASIIKPF